MRSRSVFSILSGFLVVSTLTACTLFAASPAATSVPATTPVEPTASALGTATQAVAPTLPPIVTATPAPTQPPAATQAPASNPTAAPTRTATAAPSIKILSFHMLDLKVGWSIGQSQTPTDDQILRTTDGGKTWKDLTPPDNTRKGKQATAFFLDPKNAWVSYNPRTPEKLDKVTIWRTADGGSSWKSAAVDVKSLTGDYFVPSSLGFSDADNGWMLAHMGAGMMKDYVAILRTTDGGATWKVVVEPGLNNLGATGTKSGVAFVDSKTGFVAGDYNGVMAGLLFYKTSDNGATWKLITLPDPGGAAGIYTKDGMACGATALNFHTSQWGEVMVRCTDIASDKSDRWLYTTNDGGATWSPGILPGPWGTLFFLDKDTGWYLSSPDRETTAGSKIYQTRDHGKSWGLISNVGWNGPLDFVDPKNGWVNANAGKTSVLVHSVDGGVTWGLANPVLIP